MFMQLLWILLVIQPVSVRDRKFVWSSVESIGFLAIRFFLIMSVLADAGIQKKTTAGRAKVSSSVKTVRVNSQFLYTIITVEGITNRCYSSIFLPPKLHQSHNVSDSQTFADIPSFSSPPLPDSVENNNSSPPCAPSQSPRASSNATPSVTVVSHFSWWI